jgi:hypothetical protein
MAIGADYVKLNNAHVKTEKLYASIRCDTIGDLVEWVEKEEKKKKYAQSIIIWHLLKQGHPMTNLKISCASLIFKRS